MFNSTILFILTGLALPTGEAPLQRQVFSSQQMGTTCKVVLFGKDRNACQQAAQAAFDRIAKLNSIMSDYDSKSELRLLCAQAGGDPVKISPELFTVLSRSKDIFELSEGAFDPTIAPVIKLWRRARKSIQLPDPKELKEALALVDFKKVELDKVNGTARVLVKGMQIDLGGIAKGYAVDEALKELIKRGFPSSLVVLGGDIAMGAPPPGEKGWKIGIAPVLEEGDVSDRYLILSHCAVSTSGDTEQYVEIAGVRYSHLVDPKTGIGLTRRVAATVVAKTGIDADALTKAACILPLETSLKKIEQVPGASCRISQRTDKGGVEVVLSSEFPQVHQKKEK